MVENAAQTMDSDMVNYLKRPHDLIVKLKGVFFSQPFGFVYALFSIRRMWIQELPKGLEVLPKGQEYALLTTELAAKTCQDAGSGKQRLCLRNCLSNISILPGEIIDNQIAIT